MDSVGPRNDNILQATHGPCHLCCCYRYCPCYWCRLSRMTAMAAIPMIRGNCFRKAVVRWCLVVFAAVRAGWYLAVPELAAPDEHCYLPDVGS